MIDFVKEACICKVSFILYTKVYFERDRFEIFHEIFMYTLMFISFFIKSISDWPFSVINGILV